MPVFFEKEQHVLIQIESYDGMRMLLPGLF